MQWLTKIKHTIGCRKLGKIPWGHRRKAPWKVGMTALEDLLQPFHRLLANTCTVQTLRFGAMPHHQFHFQQVVIVPLVRSQWPCLLKVWSATVRLLGFWAWILPEAWMSVSSKCVLSVRGLCDCPIPYPEESYRVVCVCVCVLLNVTRCNNKPLHLRWGGWKRSEWERNKFPYRYSHCRNKSNTRVLFCLRLTYLLTYLLTYFLTY